MQYAVWFIGKWNFFCFKKGCFSILYFYRSMFLKIEYECMILRYGGCGLIFIFGFWFIYIFMKLLQFNHTMKSENAEKIGCMVGNFPQFLWITPKRWYLMTFELFLFRINMNIIVKIFNLFSNVSIFFASYFAVTFQN